jgi:hypothetical protein
VFIFPGTAAQAAVACVLALMSLVAVAKLDPLADATDAMLYMTGCIIIFLSMFMSLLIRGEQKVQCMLTISLDTHHYATVRIVTHSMFARAVCVRECYTIDSVSWANALHCACILCLLVYTLRYFTVDIANENSQSQTVFSVLMISLNVVMILAALVQLGLIAVPACISNRTRVQQLVHRMRHRNDNNSGSNDGDSTAADTELAAVHTGARQRRQRYRDSRRPSVQVLLADSGHTDISDDSSTTITTAAGADADAGNAAAVTGTAAYR